MDHPTSAVQCSEERDTAGEVGAAYVDPEEYREAERFGGTNEEMLFNILVFKFIGIFNRRWANLRGRFYFPLMFFFNPPLIRLVSSRILSGLLGC